jgi:hypothetical protein
MKISKSERRARLVASNAALHAAAVAAVVADPESPETESILMMNAGADVPPVTPADVAAASADAPPCDAPVAVDAPAPDAPADAPAVPVRSDVRYSAPRLSMPVGTLIPVGANHTGTRGISRRYLYAIPGGDFLATGDSRLPSSLESIDLALSMIDDAATLIERTDSTTFAPTVDACGLRYGASPRHATTHAAMRLDAHDFAVSFTARVIDSVPPGLRPASCHSVLSRLPGARSNHADASARLSFVRTIAVNVRTLLAADAAAVTAPTV